MRAVEERHRHQGAGHASGSESALDAVRKAREAKEQRERDEADRPWWKRR
ncbi:MAG: hypothetical protein JK586_04345 [Nocardiopsis sp. BM-2018]|uniref:Uncharacterized protein n=1 Tax=Nocardiopsis metallicus TaxID=179819 RepID=A0A840WMM8_9ACTN|nr:hypothetical protein [Nocardiopsis metallicus]MBB5492897.1 hypothetical protein [Nocardiopsis metallicus]QRN80784.1 MAG: hypothetical protein JK586_04345 [Nocardiopsis sp. BM-2018]